ncbi:MAG: glycosyltransferase [Desulfobacteraceae bacterium]|nr:MAG: glycosyltransferase [Desulfobacteraceae bacterium]
MKDSPLRILITVDAGRTPNGPVLPHVYSTQIEFLQQSNNLVRVFGIDSRTSPFGILRNLRELKAEIANFYPDLIVAYYGTMVAAVTRCAAGPLPMVVTFRGSDWLGSANPGPYWWVRDRIGSLLSFWAARGARQIAVNGGELAESLPAGLKKKATNLPNGIDTRVFRPISREDARRQLGWEAAPKVILFNAGIGSGQVVKNLPLAEEVVQILKSWSQDVRLEKVSTYSREQVCLRMNATDCLLVTSLHEGSPDLVKEAMACNLPVVSVPCGDISERMEGVFPGYICKYDPGELSKAVGRVLSSGLRSNGREQLFAQGLDIKSVIQRVLAVYHRAVAGQ